MLLPLFASLFRALSTCTRTRTHSQPDRGRGRGKREALTHRTMRIERNERYRKISAVAQQMDREREGYWCATHSKRVLASALMLYTCIGIVFVKRRSSISHTLFRRIWRHTLSLWDHLSFSLQPMSSVTCWEACFFSMLRSFLCIQRPKYTFNAWTKAHIIKCKRNETLRCLHFFPYRHHQHLFLSSVANFALKYWLFTS